MKSIAYPLVSKWADPAFNVIAHKRATASKEIWKYPFGSPEYRNAQKRFMYWDKKFSDINKYYKYLFDRHCYKPNTYFDSWRDK